MTWMKNLVSLAVVIVAGLGGYALYERIRDAPDPLDEVKENIIEPVIEKTEDVVDDTINIVEGEATVHGAALGGRCTVGTDCRGYRTPTAGEVGVACCKRTCTMTKKDYAGISWCPHECRSGPLAKAGSC